MPTTQLYFSGVAKWAKVHKPDEKYKNFSIQLYPDEGSMNAFKESGLSMTPKTDDDGTYITFRRPETKLFGKELKEFGPPEVVDEHGKPFTGLIGNGSKVTIKVEVYDTMKGKGHRLNKVRIDELVKYERPAPEDAPQAKPAGAAPVNGLPF